MMRFISSKAHGILDYASSVLFIVSPWLFGFYEVSAATAVVVVAGVLVMIMSLFTAYEYAVVRLIPLRIHLIIDVVMGFGLILAPWFWGFWEHVYLPHVLFGILAIGAGLLTKVSPASTGRRVLHWKM